MVAARATLREFCSRAPIAMRCPAPCAKVHYQTEGLVRRERNLLRGVLAEALMAQARKRSALLEQLDERVSSTGDQLGDPKALAKAQRRAALVPQRLAEVDEAEQHLHTLQASLGQSGVDLLSIRNSMEAVGLGSRLETFDVDAAALSQYGRPDGFDGLVVESPRGIPILVGRRKFSDALLRRVGRGTDLWFQVAEGRGSRVLLRTSMHRELSKSPRACMEAAADMAAYFSEWKQASMPVDVMWTDSRHVAKRGERVGQMKGNKRLGTISGKPWQAADTAQMVQEEQGWL
jgi:uncharacterized tellurite resistance protein B-like protein